jgi:hypothetical protein
MCGLRVRGWILEKAALKNLSFSKEVFSKVAGRKKEEVIDSTQYVVSLSRRDTKVHEILMIV